MVEFLAPWSFRSNAVPLTCFHRMCKFLSDHPARSSDSSSRTDELFAPKAISRRVELREFAATSALMPPWLQLGA